MSYKVYPISLNFFLVAFTDNLLALNQFVTSYNSLFTTSILLLISLCEYNSGVISKQYEVKYIWCVRDIINAQYKKKWT